MSIMIVTSRCVSSFSASVDMWNGCMQRLTGRTIRVSILVQYQWGNVPRVESREEPRLRHQDRVTWSL